MSNLPITIDHEQLFRSLDQAYIVFGVDPDYTIIEENEAHANLALVRRSNVVGMPLREAYPHGGDTEQVIESIQRVIQTGKPHTLERVRYDIKDGLGQLVEKYWRITNHPIIENSSVVAIYQSTDDITEEIQNDHKLERLQYQLDQALTYSDIGTWLWDIKRRKIFVDKSLSRMFGLSFIESEKGITLKTFLGMVHVQDRKRVEEKIHQVFTHPGAYQSEFRMIDREGATHWVIARGKMEVNDDGKPTNFPGVIVDITDRKHAENNLRFLSKATTQFTASLSYKKTLRNIASLVVPTIADWCTVDLLNEGGELEQMVIIHKDPEKIAWAEELRKTQGPPDLASSYGVANVIRTGEPELYPRITDEILEQTIKDKKQLELTRNLGMSSVIIAPLVVDNKTIGAITLISTESRIHYKQSDLELVKGLANRAALAVYNASLYRDAQREIKERAHLQRQLEYLNEALETRVKKRTQQLETTNQGLEAEIAKRQKAEKGLQEYSESLAQSNQELQDFAFVASHDLQEPLRKIQSFGDLLESEYGANLGDGKEYLDRMRHAAARMSTLIEDLLAFSRVATKNRPHVPVDLKTIVKEVVSDLEDRINRTEGQVKVQALPIVLADPTHMRQLFQNLIGNALKFHREGVPPVVKVYAKRHKANDPYYTIYVEDNGIGFEEKYLDRIFSVFQRLHERDKYEGTGIGLAVCRKIIERYGGTITAESKKGQGSTFIITLPKEKREKSHD